MKDIPRFAATLTFVALIAAGSLAWVNEITKPMILVQQEKELKDALAYVLPGSKTGVIIPVKENNKTIYYMGYKDKEKKQFIGYAFLVLSKGYSSTIRTLVGMDSTGTIFAIRVLSQQETPGLGNRCQEVKSGQTSPWWQKQFSGKKATNICVDKDGGQIQAITGATITSRAITNGISARAKWLLEKIGLSQK